MTDGDRDFVHRIDGCVDVLHATEVALRAAQAARLCAAYEISCELDTSSDIAVDAVIAEIACALTLSHRSAARVLDDAVLICERPALLAALCDGQLDLTRTKLIAVLLGDEDLQAWEDAAIAYGQSHTAHELRRWILRKLPETDERARQSAMDKRCIEVATDRDGMSHLYGYLPTVTAEEFFAAVDALARQETADDGRTLDQRRADAVQELLDERTHVHTQVTVVLPEAAGAAGSVNGAPVPGDVARRLAMSGHAAWRVWLADSDGRIKQPAAVDGYRIPTQLARTVRARDQHCRFPGCQVPASRCDLDHTVPWPTGQTSAENLHSLCRKHHRIKHQTGWTVSVIGDNELEWVSPVGRVYRTRPPNMLARAG